MIFTTPIQNTLCFVSSVDSSGRENASDHWPLETRDCALLRERPEILFAARSINEPDTFSYSLTWRFQVVTGDQPSSNGMHERVSYRGRFRVLK